jgi:flagellar hook-associated protein FlgK
MSLSLSLHTALSGLMVNQASIAVTSQNIANANTPGYSRLSTEQSAVNVGGIGSGVQIDDITRKVDIYLERSIRKETTTLGAREQIADYYQRIQILLGEPGEGNSIDEYVSQFFDTFQSLAENPESTSFKATAVDTAEVLARELAGLALAMEDLRYQADQDIDNAVDAINTELAHLDSLNVAINRAYALNNSTASLLDQRDASLEKLASYMDLEVQEQDSGAVFVYTAGGAVPLVTQDLHQLSYEAADNTNTFVTDGTLRNLEVLTLNDKGQEVGMRKTLISSGHGEEITSVLKGGELQGLQELRDVLIPEILDQLDQLAAQLRDTVNALHNKGTGFPAASELEGTRAVSASDSYDWTGTLTIAALDEEGNPISSTYTDENYGYRPLILDLSTLDGGDGAGSPDVQTIIDEINNHFNAPPVKAQVGNLNNVQLVMAQDRLPNGGAPGTLNFDLDLDNLSGTEAETWVTNVRVVDNTGTVMSETSAGNIGGTYPSIAIDPANAYSFTSGSNEVVITTTLPHGLKEGDRIYLENPFAAATVLGGGTVTDADVSGFFEVQAVPGTNQFSIKMVSAAANATVVDNSGGAAFNALPPYDEVAAGEKTRTIGNGIISADVTANTNATYYDIEVTVGVYDNDTPGEAVTETQTITYRIYNNQSDLLNQRLDAIDSTGGVIFPDTAHQYIFAILVDEDGNELPSVNGNYGDQEGYLKLVANDKKGETVTIAIDEGDTKQLGNPNDNPPEPGTGRGFSHYFELNNFFVSNSPTQTGDLTSGSAINMAVEKRLLDDPRLISTGNLQQTLQPSDPDAVPDYTLSRYSGDNSQAQLLAKLGLDHVKFDPAGGLPASNMTLGKYAGEILGFLSAKTVQAESAYDDTSILLNGLTSRADAISGVNLDEELAYTTLYQQAYSASARAFTMTNELFGELLDMV